MTKRVEDILKIASKFEKLSQIGVSFQAADVQAALGMSESNNRGEDKDYFSKTNIDSIITDFCNKFDVSGSTNGKVDISCVNGAVSFIVVLSGEKGKEPKISNYLKAKFSNDMSKKILVYCKKKGIQAGTAVAGWLTF